MKVYERVLKRIKVYMKNYGKGVKVYKSIQGLFWDIFFTSQDQDSKNAKKIEFLEF